MVVAVAVAGLSIDVASASLRLVLAWFGVASVALLGGALILARRGWIGAVLGLLALLTLGRQLVGGAVGTDRLGFVGVALLLIGELSQWSIDSRLAGQSALGLHRSRAVGITWLVALGLAVALLSRVAAGLPFPEGTLTVAIAVAASVGLLALISVVARRSTSRPNGSRSDLASRGADSEASNG